MYEKTNNILVWIETGNDGSSKRSTLKLLTVGRRLADFSGGDLLAVVIAKDSNNAIESIKKYGADKVIAVEGYEYEYYSTDAYTNALSEVAKKYCPIAILLGDTINGKDLAPRLACRLNTGLASECIDVLCKDNGEINWVRTSMSGKINETILIEAYPNVATIRTRAFKMLECPKEPEIIKEDISFPFDKIRTRVVGVIGVDEIVDLEGAEIVVSGGCGMGGEEGFALVNELADALGATVGASRVAVDSGWVGNTHKVGQTGKIISPKLYVACGISGAVQHLVGIGGADCIVAINKDERAPIFKIANYGIVGDLREVIPVIIDEINKDK